MGEIVPSSAQFFAKLDAVHGYFQLALDEESSKLTTFLLPSGRYRHLRAPMGLSALSDYWCRVSDWIVEGIQLAMKIVDDTIIWASDMNAGSPDRKYSEQMQGDQLYDLKEEVSDLSRTRLLRVYLRRRR